MRATLRIVLVAVLAVAGCATRTGATTSQDSEPEVIRFDRHDIETGIAGPQVVLAGRLLGGAWAELAVIHADADGNHTARIFGYDGDKWTVVLEHPLGPDVRWVDLLTIDGRDRLLLYTPGQLSRIDLRSGTIEPVVEVTSVFAPPDRSDPLHVDVTHDVTGDGRDDLVVPVGAGFSVSVQQPDGELADPVLIETAIRMERIYGSDGSRFDPWSESRVHRLDHDLDGRSDLAVWRGDHFAVHRLRENGRIAAAPRSVPIAPAFDADHLSWLTEGALEGYLLRTVADLNGDGRDDLVAHRLDGARRRSAIEVYLGTDGPRRTLGWSATPDVVLPSQDQLQLDVSTVELDRTRPPALLATTLDDGGFQSGFWRRLKGAMGDDLWLHLEFRRFDSDLSGVPVATERVALDGSPSNREPMWIPLVQALRGGRHQVRPEDSPYPRAFNRTHLMGDLTGDGRTDLLLEWTHERLGLYRGVSGPAPFADEAQELMVPVPHDGELSWLTHIDGDDALDLVLHHTRWSKDIHGGPTEPPGSEPTRVILLLAE